MNPAICLHHVGFQAAESHWKITHSRAVVVGHKQNYAHKITQLVKCQFYAVIVKLPACRQRRKPWIPKVSCIYVKYTTQTHTLHIEGLLKHNLHAAEVDLFSKQFSAHHYVTTIPIKMLSLFITLSAKFPSYFLFAVNPQAPDNHQSVFCSYGFVL